MRDLVWWGREGQADLGELTREQDREEKRRKGNRLEYTRNIEEEQTTTGVTGDISRTVREYSHYSHTNFTKIGQQ